jgi:hypothetical protein
MPLVWYGCETWFLTLREQGAEENIWTDGEGTRRSKKLRNEELHNLYYSPNIIRKMK